MKKLIFIVLMALTTGLFSCTKDNNTNVTPVTPIGVANVYVSNYYSSGYYVYVSCTNKGNATAYNVSVRIYSYSGSFYANNYLTSASILAGQTVTGVVDCSEYYPYNYYYTVYTPVWN